MGAKCTHHNYPLLCSISHSKMSSFVSGYIHDLSAVKDNVKLRVCILSTWMQPLFSKPHVTNMEIIVIDEQNTRMQDTVRMALVNQFKDRLQEGNAVTLQRYSLGEIQPKFHIVTNLFALVSSRTLTVFSA